MATARKTKARKARRAVARNERVKPTPETAAKLKPHPLELLLERGRENGGIDADQLQCCEEIADAAQMIAPGTGFATADLATVGRTTYDALISPHGERLSAIWMAWAVDLARGYRARPWVIVDLIGSVDPLDVRRVALLAGACDLWARVRRDMDRPKRGSEL